MLAINTLPRLARDILEQLPPAPNGLSLAELADGFLGQHDPVSRGRIRAALDAIALVLDCPFEDLTSRRGNDDFRQVDVILYGIPAERMPEVRDAFRSAALADPSFDNA